MIINDESVKQRLSSPMNLMNRLRSDKKNSAMSLFGIGKKEEVKITFNPFQAPPVESSISSTEQFQPLAAPVQPEDSSAKLDNILENHESQIRLGLAHDNAIALLNNSISALAAKLDDVKADKLPSVISAASKTVESIRRERNESTKNNKDREVHFHFYTPQQKKVSDYEVIDVTA